MKNLRVYLMAGLSLLIFGAFVAAPEKGNKSVKVNPGDSEIVWTGAKITGSSHTGTIAIKDSELKFEDGALSGGYFIADMTSISNKDLDGGSKEKLEGHLKSDDFFGVATYPTAKFQITKVKAGAEKGTYEVHGKMTIKETTKDISFPAHVKWDGDKAIAEATVSVDRADFDVRFGSDRFFDNLGNNAIKDEFTLEVKIVSAPAS